MLTLQSRAIDQCTKAVKADKAGEDRRALYYYKESLVHLLEWLGMEKEVGAREALKARIRGYMARAEELKDVLAVAAAGAAAAAAVGEESGTATAAATASTTSKGTNAGSTSKTDSMIKKGDDKSSSSSSSSSGSNRTSIASTEVGPQQDRNNTHIQGEEGEEEQDTDTCRRLLEEMPLVPVHGSDATLPSLCSPDEEELREREAWLREWEAALVAKDLELQRRGREVSKREQRMEAWEKERKEEEEEKKTKKEKENEVEGVERDEAGMERKDGEDTHE